MTDMLRYFNAEARKSIERASAISDAADEAGRVMDDAEKAEVDALLKAAEEFKVKAEAARRDADIRSTLEALGKVDEVKGEDLAPPRTIGDAFVRSEEFKTLNLRAKAGSVGHFTTVPIRVTDAQIKAAASPVLFGASTNADGIVPTQGPLSEGDLVRTRLVIADLLPSIPVTSGNSVVYPVVKERDDYDFSSDGSVSEGGSKVEVGYEFDDESATLFKLAVFTKMSSELIEDAPALAAYINADLPLQVRAAEDSYLWGQLSAASAVSESGDNDIDGIIQAIAQINEAGFNADAVVMSPSAWATLQTLKATSGDGQYLLPPDLGVRVVLSPVADTILVGDFARGAKVYRKGGLTVDSTNSDADDFVHNLITIRAEMRLVLGITYPKAFLTV